MILIEMRKSKVKITSSDDNAGYDYLIMSVKKMFTS